MPTDEQQRRLAALDEQITAMRRGLDAQAQQMKKQRWAWEDRLLPDFEAGKLAWTYQRPTAASAANGAKLTIYNDEAVDSNFYLHGSLSSERKRGEGLMVASGPNPDNETYTVTFKPGEGAWTALGIDVFQDESLPGTRFARGADRFVLTEVDAEIAEPGGAPRKLPFVLATSGGIGERAENPPMAAIDGDPKTGWGVTIVEEYNPFLALRFAEPVHTRADSVVTVRLHHDSDLRRATIGRFRLALSAATYSWPEDGESDCQNQSQPARQSSAHLDRRRRPRSAARFAQDPAPPRGRAQPRAKGRRAGLLRILHAGIPAGLHAPGPSARRTRFAVGRHPARGAHRSHAPARHAQFCRAPTGWMKPTKSWNRPSRRFWPSSIPEAAAPRAWIWRTGWSRTQNPLTARAFVNRLWREFFGTGLSKVLEDLGSQGEWPVNPELLDWLAAEFMQDWDMRHMIRTIVTSHTYRQSSLSHRTDRRARSRQSPAGAPEPLSRGCRNRARYRAVGLRPAGRSSSAVPACARMSRKAIWRP